MLLARYTQLIVSPEEMVLVEDEVYSSGESSDASMEYTDSSTSGQE
jgi:hypothetical protein